MYIYIYLYKRCFRLMFLELGPSGNPKNPRALRELKGSKGRGIEFLN